MNRLSKIMMLIIIGTFFIQPLPTKAATVWIEESLIEAYAAENGNVEVRETHTYEFEGSFSEITRTLPVRDGKTIENVRAAENGYELNVVKDGDTYAIQRSGQDEILTIQIIYTIVDGVDFYEDLAQFHWGFFDASNPTDFEDLTIQVWPFEPAEEGIAFGYDEAYGKESVMDGGAVEFYYGRVPSNRSGDIRVAWDAETFGQPADPGNGELRPELIEALRGIEEEIVAQEENSRLFGMIGLPIVLLYGVFLIWRIWKSGRNARKVRKEMEQQGTQPEVTMPALLYFMNKRLTRHEFPDETMGIALLELIRKGNVKEVEDGHFRLVDESGLKKHEQKLVDWLFKKMGSGTDFKMTDLSLYTLYEDQHNLFRYDDNVWKEMIKNEVHQEGGLFKEALMHRAGIALTSLAMLPFLILFPANGLPWHFLLSFALTLVAIGYAYFYRPLTLKGAAVKQKWEAIDRDYPKLETQKWDQWDEEEKLRVMLFGLGMEDKKMMRKNDHLLYEANHQQDAIDSVNNLMTYHRQYQAIMPTVKTAYETVDSTDRR
ncbi:DUF2207 domain-containing protein [Jeotgalibacillus sp. R-1-5s-1]|uniref:DUF2207 domain-containing protein n=1 Tax=Jeotgalibacillus sp. R-1-5s-1 TaxID=2555897 RepID=UPI00106AD4B1|nr:DUF2207 domain-containing protein [Jeotgalibacillus sp. R-1-5s-1]TFE00175.1 DUF2207 domain-containing protein [Jeotgalibacillus sp. R-1-5s-1]